MFSVPAHPACHGYKAVKPVVVVIAMRQWTVIIVVYMVTN